MKKVREGQFSFDDRVWQTMSENSKSFIRMLLTYNPEERPSAEQALQHPWIVEANKLTTAIENHVFVRKTKQRLVTS